MSISRRMAPSSASKNLAHQHTEADLRVALSDARHMLIYWAHAEHCAAAEIDNSRLHAHVAAYPAVIATATALLAIRPQLEHPCAPTRSGTVALMINRINERTGSYHTDRTPVEQWVQNLRLVGARADQH